MPARRHMPSTKKEQRGLDLSGWVGNVERHGRPRHQSSCTTPLESYQSMPRG